MIKFFNKTKIFERPIKMTKNMLSPHKNTSRANKRKSPTEDRDVTPESKKKEK